MVSDKIRAIRLLLANENFKKGCKDVRSRTDVHFPSDHYIVEAVFAVKLTGSSGGQVRPRAVRFRQPTEAEWKNYNDKLSFLHELTRKFSNEWQNAPAGIAKIASECLTPIMNS